MGEGIGQEEAIFPFISSVNIACGGHAGDEDTMCEMVELALRHGVAIGAHPSYPDRDHFGRLDLLKTGFSPEDIPGFVGEQLALLQAICTRYGTRLHHVKPHGALYNRAAWDTRVSVLLCEAVRQFDPSLVLYGLSGSNMKTAAATRSLVFINEVFADRSYTDDGSLTPRSQPGALIGDSARAVEQALTMVQEGKVIALSGKEVPVQAETICIHGDGARAAQFAQSICESLQRGVRIMAPLP